MIRVVAMAAVCISGLIYGQSTAAQRFEVASVKPSTADPNSFSGIKTGHGRLDANYVTLKRCIMGAYCIGPNQIVGGPAWLDSERFEIVAKAEQLVDDDHALMVMLQSLLAERFKLAIHRETRTVVALVVEVAKNGPKLERGETGRAATTSGRGIIDAKNITMDRFAEVLSRQMDLPVINHTGLEGAFNLELQWVPENAMSTKPGNGAATDAGPSIFTAIQQLGLRLRSQKTPIDGFVIDHAEKPSEN